MDRLLPSQLEINGCYAYLEDDRITWGGRLVALGDAGGWLLLKYGESYYFLVSGQHFRRGAAFVSVPADVDTRRPERSAQLTPEQLADSVLPSLTVGEPKKSQAHLLVQACGQHRGSFAATNVDAGESTTVGARVTYFLSLDQEPLVRDLLRHSDSLCDH